MFPYFNNLINLSSKLFKILNSKPEIFSYLGRNLHRRGISPSFQKPDIVSTKA